MNPSKQKKSASVAMPTLIPLQDKCRFIAAGPNHSYAVANGKVYYWGLKHPHQIEQNSLESELYSQVIQNSSQTFSVLPIQVDYISTSKSHTFAWNAHEVYCWGSNQYYELGLEQEKEYGITRMELLEAACQKGYTLQNISCGQHHTLAVFFVDLPANQRQLFLQKAYENESEVFQQQEQDQSSAPIQLFAWGQSESYQLTINTLNIIPYPVLTPCLFAHLEQTYSKNDYNLAICDGKVYSWGCNLFSRLGQPLTASQLPKLRIPKHVFLPQKIIKIGIGTYHVVAVSQNGSAFSWGKGNLGQLGIDRFQAEAKPSKMVCSELIIDACCGQSHTMVLLRNGLLKTCGSNSHDALGHSVFDIKDKKKRAKKLEVVRSSEEIGVITMICSGNNHNIVLNAKGEIFGWGSNEYNQILTLDKNNNPHSVNLRLNKSRKSLQILVDNDSYDQNQKNIPVQGNQKPSQLLYLQELEDWRRKYSDFVQKKQKEQNQLMQQLQNIMKKLSIKPVY